MSLTWTCREARTYTAAGKRGEYEMREFYNTRESWVVLWLNDSKVDASLLSFDDAVDLVDRMEATA